MLTQHQEPRVLSPLHPRGQLAWMLGAHWTRKGFCRPLWYDADDLRAWFIEAMREDTNEQPE